MKYYYTLLIALTFISYTWGQEMEIKGQLIDSTTNSGLRNAVLYLIDVDDSSFTARYVTTSTGKFDLKSPLGNYQLFIEHPKFNNREFYFIATPDNYFYDLGTFSLPDKSNQLDEITIFAYKDPVYYKGDTLVYVADSFKTKPNAVVEDLIKKLPGMEVDKDGKIKAQGKDVARVLVDGDEFFGSDPTMATKNLAAGAVKDVKVYEKQLDDASVTDDKVQVIDLTLKDEAKKGYFGKADFASDFSKYYEGEGLFNRFTSKLKFSAYLLTTNTTKTSLDYDDANKFGIEMSGSRTYDSETDSRGSSADVVSSEGFPQMWKAGVFYNQKVSKKLELGANYTYTNYKVKKGQNQYSQYFLPDTVYYNQDSQATKLEHQKHEANIKIKWNIDSTQSLEIIPQFKTFETNNNIQTSQEYITQEQISTRRGTTLNDNQQDGENIKTRINYIKNFKSLKRRKLVVMDNFTYDKFNQHTLLNYEDFILTNNAITNLIDQKKDEGRTILSNLINVKYTEPFGRRWAMEFSVENFNIVNSRVNNSMDNDGTGNYNKMDSLTSNDFKSLKYQNIGEIAAVYDYKKWKITFGSSIRNVIIDNDNLFTKANIHQDVTSALPYTFLEYRFSQASKLSLNLRTYSSLPSINLLQPVYDNVNPNSIQLGNENLVPSYSFSSSLRYNNFLPISSIWIFTNLTTLYTKNDFAQNIFYDNLGRSISQYKNIDMFNYVNFFGGFGFPIYKKILFITPFVQYLYRNNYSFINNKLTKSISNSPGINLQLRFETEQISGGITLGYSNNIIKNGLNSQSNQKNNVYTLSGNLSYEMPLKFILETDFDFYAMRGLSKDFNNNTFLWNASIGKKFFKKDQLRLDLIVNDILNQNKSISRMARMNIITDTRQLIITRYFLLKLTYQFNSTMKTPSKDE